MKDGGTFGIALSCMGALIAYAGTGLREIGLLALILNLSMILGGQYAAKNLH